MDETGSSPHYPPVLVMSGTAGLLTVRPPNNPASWAKQVRFLRQLRDCAEELAALLESRAVSGACDDDSGQE